MAGAGQTGGKPGKAVLLQGILIREKIFNGRKGRIQPDLDKRVDPGIEQEQDQGIDQEMSGAGQNKAFFQSKFFYTQFCILTP